LSQSSSDSDHNSDEEENTGSKPYHPQSNQPHPLTNKQQQNFNELYSGDVDSNFNVIEDEQKMEPSDLAWNSNQMYDRLEPLDNDKPTAAEEQAAAPQANTSSILTQIKSHSTSAESNGSRIKSPEAAKPITKPPPLQKVLSPPPPPPPPPKIPSGQFVAAPPLSPQVVTTNPVQQRRYNSTGDLLDLDGVNERAVDCGKDQVIRRQKEPPKPETVATRNAIMAWMMEQQSK